MPDLTVSSNVDSFLSAANYAAMRVLLGLRESLTADLTLYVRTDGSDSNNGLANTSGGAFLTWQGAINAYSRRYDDQGYTVTIQAGQATTTFSIGASLVIKKAVGNGSLILDFNSGTLQSSGALTDNGPNQRALVENSGEKNATLKGVTLVHANTSANGAWNVTLRAQSGAELSLDSVTFGSLVSSSTFSSHMISESNGKLFFTNNYSITGGAGASNNAANHYLARNGGIIDLNDSITVTITGTPKFNIFTNVQATGIWSGYLPAYSGGVATGCTKHSVSGNGVINTYGASLITLFPGSVNGTPSSISSSPSGAQFL